MFVGSSGAVCIGEAAFCCKATAATEYDSYAGEATSFSCCFVGVLQLHLQHLANETA